MVGDFLCKRGFFFKLYHESCFILGEEGIFNCLWNMDFFNLGVNGFLGESVNYLKVYARVCLCTGIFIRMEITKFSSDHACLYKCTFGV